MQDFLQGVESRPDRPARAPVRPAVDVCCANTCSLHPPTSPVRCVDSWPGFGHSPCWRIHPMARPAERPSHAGLLPPRANTRIRTTGRSPRARGAAPERRLPGRRYASRPSPPRAPRNRTAASRAPRSGPLSTTRTRRALRSAPLSVHLRSPRVFARPSNGAPLRRNGRVTRRTSVRTMTAGRLKAARRRSRNRRRPTLPGPCGPSTIGAEGLNCSVRKGKRCFPLAVATGNW